MFNHTFSICVLILLQEPLVDYVKNPELRKLQFHGAGPKAAIPKVEEADEEGTEPSEPEISKN